MSARKRDEITSGILAHYQCPTSLVLDVWQPFDLVTGCLERDDAAIVGKALVKVYSFMLSKLRFVMCEAVLHVDGYVENLE